MTRLIPGICVTGVILTIGQVRPPCAAADAAASRPATSTAPAEPLDPAVERILDRLEKKTVRDIEAKLVYVKKDPILEDEQRFHGILRFLQDKPNPRFFIHFDRVTHDGIAVKNPQEWHVFDGQHYWEAREKTRTTIKRQIVKPGEQIDVFRIGQGPFPLPFGQSKAEIVRHFTVKLVPPSPQDPKEAADSDHLECTPLPGAEMDRKYGKVHFYIDRKLDLPVCVRTVEKEQGQEISASFSDIRVNTGLAASRLNLPDLGYPVVVE